MNVKNLELVVGVLLNLELFFFLLNSWYNLIVKFFNLFCISVGNNLSGGFQSDGTCSFSLNSVSSGGFPVCKKKQCNLRLRSICVMP